MVKRVHRRISIFTIFVLILLTLLISPQLFLFKFKIFLFSAFSSLLSPMTQSESFQTENDRLRENRRKMTILLKEKEDEIHRLKNELSLYESFRKSSLAEAGKAVPGKVIYYNPSLAESSILVDCGAQQGVKEGNIALEGCYLLGKVIHVSKSTCKILLLNDSRSAFSVSVGKNRLSAIIKGQGKGRRLTAEFIDNQPENVVFRKDHVITSGFTKGIPSGVLIGEISNDPSEDTRKYNSFLDIRIRPFVNTLCVKNIFILSPVKPSKTKAAE